MKYCTFNMHWSRDIPRNITHERGKEKNYGKNYENHTHVNVSTLPMRNATADPILLLYRVTISKFNLYLHKIIQTVNLHKITKLVRFTQRFINKIFYKFCFSI